MNRYQKLVCSCIKNAEPVDEILCKEANVTIPSYRGKRIAWRDVLKVRCGNNLEEIRSINSFVRNLRNSVAETR